MHSLRSFAAAFACGIALAAVPSAALAQASPLPESITTGPQAAPSSKSAEPASITVGAWTFRPIVEVRIRGEYRRDPYDVGGNQYESPAILAQGYQSALPAVTGVQTGVRDLVLIAERARAGIAIDRGPVTAAVTLQDARAWGTGAAVIAAPGQPSPPVFAPYEAYLDVHTRSGRRVFFRIGRQAVTWGDGRLLGANDWSMTGRSLDAARFGFQVGDVDVELLGALLAMPGSYALPAAAAATASTDKLREGSGAQLYGLNAIWHAFPLLNVELTGLARVAREPLPSTLTPANTFVIDGRISGDYRGFRYAVEGAAELGKVASYGENRDLRAFAFAARASWETALPGHLTFGAEAAFASGDKSETTGTIRRFDPILPDEHTWLSPMSLFAWSNLILGGGTVAVRPIDELGIVAGYRYAALADARGRWSNAALAPIGAAVGNDSRSLGHEIDLAFKITPWRPLEIEPGYGLFIRGDGARQILATDGPPGTLRVMGAAPALQHWAYLQITGRLP